MKVKVLKFSANKLDLYKIAQEIITEIQSKNGEESIAVDSEHSDEESYSADWTVRDCNVFEVEKYIDNYLEDNNLTKSIKVSVDDIKHELFEVSLTLKTKKFAADDYSKNDFGKLREFCTENNEEDES